MKRTLILLGISLLLAGVTGGGLWYMKYSSNNRYLTIADQIVDSRKLTLRKVSLPQAGFIRIYIHRDESIETPLLGQTPLLTAGTHENVQVIFYREFWERQQPPVTQLRAAVFADADSDGEFTEMDSEPMRDADGQPIVRVFGVTPGPQLSPVSCADEISPGFADGQLRETFWENLTGVELADGMMTLTSRKWLSGRIVSRPQLEGDFDLRVRYRSFVASSLGVDGQETLAHTTVYNTLFEKLLSVQWVIGGAGSYIEGIVNGAPAGERLPIEPGSQVTVRLQRIGTTGSISVLINDSETVLQQTDIMAADPVFLGIVVEDMQALTEEATGVIDSVTIACPSGS